MSIAEMAIVTGVLFRLYRALAMTVGPTTNWLYFGGAFALGLLFILGMATLHLGNFPLHRWLWRAPVFAAIEAAAESLTSLALDLRAPRADRVGARSPTRLAGDRRADVPVAPGGRVPVRAAACWRRAVRAVYVAAP